MNTDDILTLRNTLEHLKNIIGCEMSEDDVYEAECAIENAIGVIDSSVQSNNNQEVRK